MQPSLPRQPGESLREWRERLIDSEFVPRVLIVAGLWMVCVVEWAQKTFGQSPDPVFWAGIATLVTIFAGWHVFGLRGRIRRMKRGEVGERIVGSILEALRASGFVVFHDLTGETGNVDHVVVGPSGVFAIETKFRSGRGTIEYRNANQLLIGDRLDDQRALAQARGGAAAVHARIAQRLGARYWVKPLVVFVGEWRIRRHPGDFVVDVLAANQLSRYFEYRQPELTGREISEIAAALQR